MRSYNLAEKFGRVLGAVVVAAVGSAVFSLSPAGATTNEFKCAAIVLNSRPYSYSMVTVIVSTKPGALVYGTETAGTHSWAMTPSATANALGRARLYQKASAVAKVELVRVSVRVTLDGASGHCSTSYTPPSLVVRNLNQQS